MLYANSCFVYVDIALVATERPMILMSDLPCLQDFRLRDINEYAEWYGHAHRAPELQVFFYFPLQTL
jgi:N-acetyl-gamma-glutamylphosphate reductase